MEGPYGNGFPKVQGKIALVGGGAGIAPLYFASKILRSINTENIVDIYLGFSDTAILYEEYKNAADKLHVNVGGFIIDDIDPNEYDYVLTCGPKIMMQKLYEKCKGTKAKVYVSMENRMGCGIGACLVCSCKTINGNKKVCKDGPVFLGAEVFEVE